MNIYKKAHTKKRNVLSPTRIKYTHYLSVIISVHSIQKNKVKLDYWLSCTLKNNDYGDMGTPLLPLLNFY
jgi:hypothetical protein